ncbi:MAG: Mur ligase family protein, partial [bacterium]
VSNRQLLDLPYSPHVAVVTNVAPHHLDDHGSLGAYVEAKRTIVRHQSAADHAVLNADDALVAGMAEGAAGTVHWFSRRRPVERGAAVDAGRIVLTSGRGGAPRPVLDVTDLATSAAHVVENALAAVTAAAIAGVQAEAMAKVLRAFRGLPYRFHLVGERGGVAFFEDSLATNPTAAAAAISGMTRPFHLIAGGQRRAAKPDDFAPMVRALTGSPVRAIYLIGATAPVLTEALAAVARPSGPRVVQAGTLERAVTEAWEAAASGEAIVLSPGCESFDQFTDYRHRGDRFRALVENLPARAGSGKARGASV